MFFSSYLHLNMCKLSQTCFKQTNTSHVEFDSEFSIVKLVINIPTIYKVLKCQNLMILYVCCKCLSIPIYLYLSCLILSILTPRCYNTIYISIFPVHTKFVRHYSAASAFQYQYISSCLIYLSIYLSILSIYLFICLFIKHYS